MDHGFYRSIILPRTNGERKTDSITLTEDMDELEKLIRQDMDSIIDPQFSSFITNKQEELIPQKTMHLEQ
jgi:hypothetical protein